MSLFCRSVLALHHCCKLFSSLLGCRCSVLHLPWMGAKLRSAPLRLKEPPKHSLNADAPDLCSSSACAPSFRLLFCTKSREWSHFHMGPEQLRRRTALRELFGGAQRPAGFQDMGKGEVFLPEGLINVNFHSGSLCLTSEVWI